MVIVAQNANRIYFTDSADYIEAIDEYVVLFKNNKQKIIGKYESPNRARNVLADVANNLKFSNVVLPDV